MINIQFKLKDSKAEGKTSIQCFFYHNNVRFVYSLGNDKTIFPELWDKKIQRPVDTRNKTFKDLLKSYAESNFNIELELKNIHQRIENVITEINKFILSTELQNKTLSFDDLKKHLHLQFNGKDHTDKKAATKKISLNEYIEKFIQDIDSGVRTHTESSGERKLYEKATVKLYKEFKTQFDLFQKNAGKHNFDDIDMNFYDKYVSFFEKKNYKTNSIGKQIKSLKVVLNAALSENIHNNREFQRKEFKTLKNEVTNVYLDTEELQRMEEIDLSSKPHLELARDVFICGCYTALRYSDYNRLNKDFIVEKDGDHFLDMITQKTKYRVFIPIKPIIFNILQKYNFTLPATHGQKVNKNIKEVAQLCGIDSLVEIKENIGSKVRRKFVPKYQMIMTHTARRTGATLLYKSGVSTLDIMKITGHKTEKTFLNYIKINVEENANRLKDNPFFK